MSEALDKNGELISKRWAHALIELTEEDSNLSRGSVLKDLDLISETISSSEELSNIIINPSVSSEEKQIVICKLFQNRVSNVVYNFIFALNLRKRLHLIGDITVEYKKESDVLDNIKHVSITSAIELDENKKEEIRAKIASKLNASVDINWGIDESIIAGLIFNIENVVVDDSVRHKLEDLSKNIIKS